jgi:hypothetical protein
MTRRLAAWTAFGIALSALPPATSPAQPAVVRDESDRGHADYRRVVEQTVAMVSNAEAQQMARRHGLSILNLTWEDTGRYKGSAVGPNISDMTIQVQLMDPRTEQCRLYCMPVIRFPNFSDRSADLSPDRFQLLVGNEKGAPLRRVTLREYLGHVRSYLGVPGSWKGERQSLLADRDTHVLVSAQACFLPIPKRGNADFNPVLFNYQSCAGDPAVLAVLVTREGTSATVIDNQRDGFAAGRTWGQRLFYNLNGRRAILAAQRLSDFAASGGTAAGGATPEANEQEGLNMVLLVQVPLRQRNPMRGVLYDAVGGGAPPAPGAAMKSARSDVEDAVIGHGRVEGPFTEIDNLEIRRDARYPVRVTVQFYKATSNGVVSERDLADIARQINRVYEHADYVGSLVTEGMTGRPTEYEGEKIQPPGWWAAFWDRHEKNTGMTRDDAMRMLRRLLGPAWMPESEEQLAKALREVKG